MDYNEFNDNELLTYICENNETAKDIIFRKYEPLIKLLAGKFFVYCANSGLEINDLIQEGMLGLNGAINSYDEQRNTTFYTFARTCIQRAIISLVISTTRKKRIALNSSVSLDFPEDEKYRANRILCDRTLNPEKILIDREYENNLLKKIRYEATPFESEVFELSLAGFSYQEMSDILDKDVKSVANALQRLRAKVKKIINELD